MSVFNAGTAERPGRPTRWRMLTARGFTAGSVGNAPSDGQGQAGPGLHHAEERPLRRSSWPGSSARRTKVRGDQHRPRARASTSWSATASTSSSKARTRDRRAQSSSVCVPAPTASHRRPPGRPGGLGGLGAAAQPVGQPTARRHRAQPVLGRLAAALRGVTTSMSSPRRSTVRWSGTSVCPSRTSSETDAPDRQPQLADLDAVQLRLLGDVDLQQVGGDPLERRRLDLEVARPRRATVTPSRAATHGSVGPVTRV